MQLVLAMRIKFICEFSTGKKIRKILIREKKTEKISGNIMLQSQHATNAPKYTAYGLHKGSN